MLIDISKVFDFSDYIPHDVMIAKFHAYDFSEKTVTFIYSNLKRWKEIVKIDDIFSTAQRLIPGVP